MECSFVVAWTVHRLCGAKRPTCLGIIKTKELPRDCIKNPEYLVMSLSMSLYIRKIVCLP